MKHFIPPDYETAWFVDFYDTRKILFLKTMTRKFPKDQEPKEKKKEQKNQNYRSLLRQIQVSNF